MVLSGCTSSIQGRSSKEKRPNIVLIMVDDMGFSDIGCYGGAGQWYEHCHCGAYSAGGL